jgi:hypothetical protein
MADVAAHPSLTELQLEGPRVDAPIALDAFVGAAVSLPLLRTVKLHGDGLLPASAPALARLLSDGRLAEFDIELSGGLLTDLPAAELLAGALRRNTTLTALTLRAARLWTNREASAALLGALTGHGSLRQLTIAAPVFALPLADEQQWAGALLGALVAANAPALTALDVSASWLADPGLRPMFEALPANTHLRALTCHTNYISDALVRDVLLPAVRANTSLRRLHASQAELRESGLFEGARVS